MRYRCYACPVPITQLGGGTHPEFEADKALCPKCGAGHPAVWPLVDVHFLAPDPKGPILGGGRRYKVACTPAREYLASDLEHYAATGDAQAVTCPSCMGTREWQDRAATIAGLAQVLEIIRDKGCC